MPLTTTNAIWRPRMGACPAESGFRFEVWSPVRRRVELLMEPSSTLSQRLPLTDTADGTLAVTLADVKAGDRYVYFLDGEGPFPDPASRYQPEGVHGPSQIIDPSQFAWSDHDWRGVQLQDAIFYELHVGTFTLAGTFAGVTERLQYLADLGVTVVELMPVADFPGRRNWGQRSDRSGDPVKARSRSTSSQRRFCPRGSRCERTGPSRGRLATAFSTLSPACSSTAATPSACGVSTGD